MASVMVSNQHYAPGTSAKWERTEDGFLRCRARVLREGIMPYRRAELTVGVPPEITADPIMMLVTMDSLSSADSLRSLEGAPVVVGQHEWITQHNIKTASHGYTAGAPVIVGPYVEVDLLVTDPQAITEVEFGLYPEISAAYHADSTFEPGIWDGRDHDATQTKIRYNHIAVIPAGHGRAGVDVKILNEKQDDSKRSQKNKGEIRMELVKIRLPKTGKFINTDEDGAKAIDAENEEGQKATQSFEDAMGQLEEKNGQLTQLQSEIEELKGQLKIFKDKLDELMSDEAAEGKALEMIADQHQSDEIIENEVEDEKAREEIKNSTRTLHGVKLFNSILQAVGIKTEGMSDEAIRGAFKAQHQLSQMNKGRRAVAGAGMTSRMMAQNTGGGGRVERTPHERLGLKIDK